MGQGWQPHTRLHARTHGPLPLPLPLRKRPCCRLTKAQQTKPEELQRTGWLTPIALHLFKTYLEYATNMHNIHCTQKLPLGRGSHTETHDKKWARNHSHLIPSGNSHGMYARVPVYVQHEFTRIPPTATNQRGGNHPR